MIDIKTIEQDYKPQDGPFREDEDDMDLLKRIIFYHLTEDERRILLIYSDTRSFYKTARLFNVSPTSIFKRVEKIRNKIKNILNSK